jgi:hypothetical protein
MNRGSITDTIQWVDFDVWQQDHAGEQGDFTR